MNYIKSSLLTAMLMASTLVAYPVLAEETTGGAGDPAKTEAPELGKKPVKVRKAKKAKKAKKIKCKKGADGKCDKESTENAEPTTK